MIISNILLYVPLFFAIVTTFLLNFSLFFYKIDVTIIVANCIFVRKAVLHNNAT